MIVLDASALVELLLGTRRGQAIATRISDPGLGLHVPHLADIEVAQVLRRYVREGELDATETNDFYELVVERHRRASTIVTSNREPAEWMSMMNDALLAQSAIDRLTSGAHTLIIEGPSYRQRTSPTTPGNPRGVTTT